MARSPGDSTVPGAMGLVDSIPPSRERLLRQAVLDHVRSERRRVFAPVLHVGLPGRTVTRLPLGGQRLDHALRTDALEAMLRRVRVCAAAREQRPAEGDEALLVWVTRSGTLQVQDVDLAWSGATSTAAAEVGGDLSMVVVTRQGWRDPRTGAVRTWRRLRAPRG